MRRNNTIIIAFPNAVFKGKRRFIEIFCRMRQNYTAIIFFENTRRRHFPGGSALVYRQALSVHIHLLAGLIQTSL